ncbi:hypothetical protein DV738_g2815, partial [Chaetothyriales sp. CBS 135597]
MAGNSSAYERLVVVEYNFSLIAMTSALGSVDLTLSGATATSLFSKLGRTPSRRAAETASAATGTTATTTATTATPTATATATTAASFTATQPQRVYTPMTSVDSISGFFYDGPRHVSTSSKNVLSASTLCQHIHDMSNKRIATLNYLRRVHQGHSCWFNTVHFSEADISRLPSYSPSRLSRRATNYMLLGMSIPALLDLYPLPHPSNQPAAKANLAAEYLRALLALLTEFEAFQQLHPTDGSSSSSLTRAPGHATFPPPPPADAPNSLLLPNEGPYSHLLTPPLPFAPDFFVVFATLCDVLIDAYQRLQQLLCSPAICTPALSDSFSKVDARLRKVMVAGIVREFETASREAARREIVGLQRVVLGGLMG